MVQSFGASYLKKGMALHRMRAAETIVYQTGNLDRFLAYGPEQHPIVLQIGGNNLENLAKATQLATPYGYDEINFNCGCPSSRVAGHGCFGVPLMLDPKFVSEAMCVIAANTNVPVSVKCRIGLDDHDSYNELCDFFYKQIIEKFPHSSTYYYALLRDIPDLQFTINGGINSIEEFHAARMEGAHGVIFYVQPGARLLNNIRCMVIQSLECMGVSQIFGMLSSSARSISWRA
ncbi:hypothetical protein K7X08_008188 [Anisodus acutangulus]|uniref:DUS-like FMN-binding domain-containing protein n=1 Tax=Anisodus acutangulus TaxID=402998 RepID=A0A9Q1RNW8_9SOLA|nr:hypothetical protein K7X08_008188 [Anisodus acutangulus]